MQPVVSDNETISEDEQVVEEEHVFDAEQDLKEHKHDALITVEFDLWLRILNQYGIFGYMGN